MALLYRVRTLLTGVGVVGGGVSVFHFDAAGGSPQSASTAAAAFWNGVEGAMTPRVTWTMDTAVDTIESTTNTLVSITGVTTDFGTGTVANDSLPTATQGRVEWYTGNVVNGRQLKGRTFIPSPGEIHSDGNPVAAYRTITDAAATALIGSAIAAPVIYSPTHKVFFDILTSATWTKWSVLRSRRD